MEKKLLAMLMAFLLLGVLAFLTLNQGSQSTEEPTTPPSSRTQTSRVEVETHLDTSPMDVAWRRSALETGTQSSVDEGGVDPAIRACQDALESLLTPTGRATVRERTYLSSVQNNPRLNPSQRVLTQSETAELQELMRSWDQQVEQARFDELCEHWRTTAAAVERGDYHTYPVGQPPQYANILTQFGGQEATAIDLPGIDDRTNRIVILTATNSPAYFEVRQEHKQLRQQRDQAIKAFFLRG